MGRSLVIEGTILFMKETLKSIVWMLFGGLAMLPLEMLGARLSPVGWARWAFWLFLAALVAVYAASIVCILNDAKKKEPDVVAERDEAVRRQQALVRDSAPEKAAITRLECRVWLTWAAMIALHALLGLFEGMGYGSDGTGIFVSVLSMCTLAPLLAFALRRPKQVMPQKGTELCKEEFPELYAMAHEVAAENGHSRRLRLFLGEAGIGVFRGRAYDGMLLPSLLTRFMTKSELKQVMRHEFAHLVCEELELEARWLSLIDRMDDAAEDCTFCFFGMFALLPVWGAFRERVTEYRALIERELEAAADALPLSPTDARDAVAAIAKSGMFVRFCEEDCVSAYRSFESEAPRGDQVDIRGEVFQKMLDERGRLWLEELESEQPAQFDTHPTFSQRRKAFGVTNFDAFAKETDAAWLREMDRLCEKENAFLADNPAYEVMRRRQYVARRSAMENYEMSLNASEPLESGDIVEAAEAYFGLDTPRAMAIVRDLLEKEPQNLEAKLLLGIWLLDARDDDGLALLYEVAENGNYTSRAMSEVGEYVYRRGRAHQIEEYRRRSAELLQQAADFHYQLDEIRMSELKPRTISDALLNELVAEMVRLGEGNIEAIACAAKAFSEKEDAHVFVLEYAGNDEDRNEETNVRVFQLLDRHEENYALRDSDEMPLKKLEKQVPGCVVYTKNDR